MSKIQGLVLLVAFLAILGGYLAFISPGPVPQMAPNPADPAAPAAQTPVDPPPAAPPAGPDCARYTWDGARWVCTDEPLPLPTTPPVGN